MSWAAERTHRIRWAECDLHGHVNHAAYLILFEDMRVAHWESLGRSFRPGGIGPVVAQLHARYLAPLGYGETVRLCMNVPTLRRTSFTHEYVVLKDGARVFECRAVIVCVDNATGARIPIPPEARALMIGRDGARPE